MRFRTGLVVGKFAPLHRGHELVIRTAVEQCDQVLVFSWMQPEVVGFEAHRRATWLERLFPETRRLVLSAEGLADLAPPAELAELPGDDVDVVVHRRLTAWVCEHHFGARPDAVFTSEDYGAPWAEDLARWFGRPVASVLVDRDRRSIPISGTELRADIHAHRQWLSPEVYRDFVRRVVLLGAESTGKSTLAAKLAEALETIHVTEYGRDLWVEKAGVLEFDDMPYIARTQVAREEAALGRSTRWLVCDTSPLTTLFYSEAMFGRAAPELVDLGTRAYERTLLLAPDFPLVQDGTRQDEAFRARQDQWYRRELAARGVRYTELRGSLDARAAAAIAAL